MSSLTPEDLEKCRLRLADLPELDSVGLWLCGRDDGRGLLVSTTDVATRDRVARWAAERVATPFYREAPELLHKWRDILRLRRAEGTWPVTP